MPIDETKAKSIIEGIFKDILNKKNFNLFDSYFADNIVTYDGKDKYANRSELRKNIEERCKAIPDFKYTLDDIVIHGNKVAFRWHGKGNTVSEFSGFKPGKSANYWGVSMCELNPEGKIVKGWETSTVTDAIPQK
jgi:predicted ester cyclase